MGEETLEIGGESEGDEIVIRENLRVIGPAKCIIIISQAALRAHLRLVAMMKVTSWCGCFSFTALD